jgi:hypothetical protein
LAHCAHCPAAAIYRVVDFLALILKYLVLNLFNFLTVEGFVFAPMANIGKIVILELVMVHRRVS